MTGKGTSSLVPLSEHVSSRRDSGLLHSLPSAHALGYLNSALAGWDCARLLDLCFPRISEFNQRTAEGGCPHMFRAEVESFRCIEFLSAALLD